MTNVIQFPRRSAPDAFGGCPRCGGYTAGFNIDRDHFRACETHRTVWCFGSNLFSGWRDESPAIWDQNRKQYAGYVAVRPIYPAPSTPERPGSAKPSYPAPR